MVVYNITTKVHASVDQDWLRWQQEVHIPAIMKTGLFKEFRFLRLLEQDDTEGHTYATQFTAASAAEYQQYIRDHAGKLRQEAIEKWGDRIISFRSLLELIQ
jgi:hypothetical protein